MSNKMQAKIQQVVGYFIAKFRNASDPYLDFMEIPPCQGMAYAQNADFPFLIYTDQPTCRQIIGRCMPKILNDWPKEVNAPDAKNPYRAQHGHDRDIHALFMYYGKECPGHRDWEVLIWEANQDQKELRNKIAEAVLQHSAYGKQPEFDVAFYNLKVAEIGRRS